MLCVAVMLSVMVLGAGAAFSDQDQIENTEAVEMATALNIISGYEDGSYHPERNIKRSEMCKMICIALNGGKEPATSTKDEPTFSDIDGHWAEGFIEYCYTEGVVSGVGDGRFNPDGNVTVTQAAKMLLVALGYNADVENFNGGNWSLYVNVKANQDGIYEGLETIDTASALNRDDAAQMIWNTLQAKSIIKESSIDITDGSIVEHYKKGDNSMLTDKYNAFVTNADVLQTVTRDSKGTYTLSTAGAGGSDPYEKNSFIKVEGDYSALLGQAVRITYQVKNNESIVLGVYATDDNDVVTANMNQIESVTTTEIKIDGTKYKLASTNKYNITDGAYTGGNNLGLAYSAGTTELSTDVFALIDNNGDGLYDGAVITTVALAQVAYANSTEVIAGGKSYKLADNNVDEGIAKNDFVTISYNVADDCSDINKIEPMTGTVDAEKTVDGVAYAQINGEWYAKNGETLTVGNNVSFCAVNGVVVPDSVESASSDLSDLVFVSEVDTGTINKDAKVYYMDGHSAVVAVDDSATDSDKTTVTAGNFYVITETSAGYKFRALNSAEFGASYNAADGIFNGYTYTDGAANDVDDSSNGNTDGNNVDNMNGTAIADDAVVFVFNNTIKAVKVITGEQLKTLDINSSTGANNVKTQSLGWLKTTVNGVTKATVIAVEHNNTDFTGFTPTAASAGYGIVVDTPVTVDGGIRYTVWNGEENIIVTDKSGKLASAVTKFSVVGYSTITADGEIKDSTVQKFDGTDLVQSGADLGSAALTGFEKGSDGYYDLYVDGGATAIDTDNKTVFLYMNSSATEAEEIGLTGDGVLTKDNLADNVYDVRPENVLIYTDSANHARVVVIDVTNRLALAASKQYTLTISGTAGVTVEDADGNVLNNSSKLKAGDLLTIKISGAATDQLTTTNAGDVKDTTGTKYEALTNASVSDGSMYTVVVNGGGNVTVTGAHS